MKLGSWGKDADRPIGFGLTAKGHAALAKAERVPASPEARDTDDDY